MKTNSVISQTSINSFITFNIYFNIALYAILIYYDNQNAIAFAKNLESYTQSKHINIQSYYQREKNKDRFVEFKFILNKQ